MAITWLGFERKRKKGFIRFKTEEWEETDVTKFLKIISFLGIFLGILMVWAAVVGMINDIPPSFAYRDYIGDHYDPLTSWTCIIIGAVCFMKPLNDIPWAALIGIFAGILVGVLVAMNIPEELIEYSNMKYFVVGTGIVVATIVGVAIKFWISSLQTISRVLSYPPVALIIAVYCIIQSLMLIAGGVSLAAMVPPI